METKNLYKSIFDVGEEYKESIKSYTPTDKGDLQNSIENKPIDDGFIIEANSYFKFLDKGINGKKINRGSIFSYTDKKPPIAGLMDWANKRSINPYAVQNSIYNKGIEARGILEKAIDNIKGVENKITGGYIKDIKKDIENEYNK